MAFISVVLVVGVVAAMVVMAGLVAVTDTVDVGAGAKLHTCVGLSVY